MLRYLPSSSPDAAKQNQLQAAVAAALESEGEQKKARRCCSCRRRHPDRPNPCKLRWICEACGWVMQTSAADDVVVRTRAALLKQPDLICLFMTINAPPVEDLAHEVEILDKVLRWLLRNRKRSKKSAWSVVRGTYWWLDFAPRKGSSEELLVHLHILLVCDLDAVRQFAGEEADRRKARGLRGLRKWVWPLMRHALRRDVVAGMEHLYPDEFVAEKEPSFFHVRVLEPHGESGCETVVPGSRAEILEHVRKVADYSWATAVKAEQGQLTMAQRVAIECLGGKHRGCSGVFRAIPGIKDAIRSFRRRKIIGRRMAAQMRLDDEFEQTFGADAPV